MVRKDIRISIVGYGRFGKVLYRLMRDDFTIALYSRSGIEDHSDLNKATTIATSIEDIYHSDVVFYAVPIGKFEQVVHSHHAFFREGQLLVDVLSVKLHPSRVFARALRGTGARYMLTHPMFGPDSSRDGFDGLPIVIDRGTADTKQYMYWNKYFRAKGLKVVEMSPGEHDTLAARSQGITHFVGRLLEGSGFSRTPIDTKGVGLLHQVMEQTVHDSMELFTDLQRYNPYTQKMRRDLLRACEYLDGILLQRPPHEGRIRIGIQGGKGSFNEEAIMHHVKQHDLRDWSIKYLHTSEAVMKALHEGRIERGQMAIHNSAGGIVHETISALARYRCRIVNQFQIKIAHALMIHPEANISEVTIIMTHPQVLAQCKHTLARKYPHLILMSGKGARIDHALVARDLARGQLPKHVATMGSRRLAEIYGLRILEEDLQDLPENLTTFIHVDPIGTS